MGRLLDYKSMQENSEYLRSRKTSVWKETKELSNTKLLLIIGNNGSLGKNITKTNEEAAHLIEKLTLHKIL